MEYKIMHLHENDEIFSDLIEETADIIGLPEVYVEKDYWVTRSLQHLSKSKYANTTVFKGGTSLSKAHKLINRFSEDIDLAVLPVNQNDTARKKLLKDIEKVATEGLTYLPNDERESKGSKFRRTVHQYPRLIKADNFGQASPQLLVELNSFTNPEPYETREIQSLITEVLIKKNKNDLITQFNLESFSINVLSVKRTLVEKMLCIVKDSYSSDPLKNLSKHIRHLYDICLILSQNEYRNFVSSNDFELLIARCIADEKYSGFESKECLDQPFFGAPIFSNFKSWHSSLDQVYKRDFSTLVYGQLPTMDAIENSLMFLRKNLK